MSYAVFCLKKKRTNRAYNHPALMWSATTSTRRTSIAHVTNATQRPRRNWISADVLDDWTPATTRLTLIVSTSSVLYAQPVERDGRGCRTRDAILAIVQKQNRVRHLHLSRAHNYF